MTLKVVLLEICPEREAVTLTVVVPAFLARIFSWKPSAVTSATRELELVRVMRLALVLTLTYRTSPSSMYLFEMPDSCTVWVVLSRTMMSNEMVLLS